MSSVTDEIKSRIDLVELIGRSVELKRAGSAYRGLCPFHSEKTPSFYVRPQTSTWHCFGCNKGGTIFDWVMEREGLDFSDALRTLAQTAGVALPERHDPREEDQSRRLVSILSAAQTFYEAALWGASGLKARDYLARRGLEETTIRAFGLGYAPNGNALIRHVERDGYSEQELQAAGVIGINDDDGHPYDFFRDRLLFPIRDGQGRTIAFGGRSLDDAAGPKYLNSRDTLLFHKHETLFALDLARRAMSQERQVVIVEGYMDAATAHQHGYRNVVATLGTAVTDRHLRVLRRQVDEIILSLDADAAGQAATWRALQVADESLRSGLTPVVGPTRRKLGLVPDRAVRLKVLALPRAKDPDELIRTDPRAWPDLVRAAEPVVDFVIRRLSARHDLSTAQGKAAAAGEVAEVLAGIANPIEQDAYVNDVAMRLGVDPDAVRRLIGSPTARRPQRTRSQQPDSPASATSDTPGSAVERGDPNDDYLLALLMRLREIPEAAPLEADPEFMLPESRALYDALGGPIPPELEPAHTRAARYSALVAMLPTPVLREHIDLKRLEIRHKKLEREHAEVNALLKGGAISSEEASARLDATRQKIADIASQLPPERERVVRG